MNLFKKGRKEKTNKEKKKEIFREAKKNKGPANKFKICIKTKIKHRLSLDNIILLLFVLFSFPSSIFRTFFV